MFWIRFLKLENGYYYFFSLLINYYVYFTCFSKSKITGGINCNFLFDISNIPTYLAVLYYGYSVYSIISSIFTIIQVWNVSFSETQNKKMENYNLLQMSCVYKE